MAFVRVPGTCQVELVYNCNGAVIENVLYFRHPSVVTVDDQHTLGALIASWWNTSLKPRQGNHLSMREILVRDLTYEDRPTIINVTYQGVIGSLSGGTATPNNVTYCISFRTANRGRAYRGRNFTCGLRSNMFVGDVVDGSNKSLWLTAYNRLLPGGTNDPTPFRWVVVSRWNNGVQRSEGITTPITAVSGTDDFMDSQRRRLRGRGT